MPLSWLLLIINLMYTKDFKLETFWFEHRQFLDIIKQSWSKQTFNLGVRTALETSLGNKEDYLHSY